MFLSQISLGNPKSLVGSCFSKFDDNKLKIISFDVGIKNLAYCILSYDASVLSTNKYSIYDWGIIDLITEENDLECTQLIKSGVNKGTKCTKKAAFFVESDKSQCCCGTHKSNLSDKKLVPIKMVLLCEEPMKSGARRNQPCNKKANHYKELATGERIGYCSVHSKKIQGLSRYYTVDNITDIEVRYRLFQQLDKKVEFKQADTILIEHQPKHAREKIKGIAYSIFDYFVLRGMIDNDHVKFIKSIDAKNKLTIYDGPPLSCPLKVQYDRNKWYGRKYCEWIIRSSPELLKFYHDFKKKDDLADSFLQGAWYLAYGQHGKKGNITSNHQKLVYLEQNTAKYKKVRRVKPQKKQLNKGKFTLSNIKYFAQTLKPQQFTTIKGLINSINFYFGDLDKFIKIMS